MNRLERNGKYSLFSGEKWSASAKAEGRGVEKASARDLLTPSTHKSIVMKKRK